MHIKQWGLLGLFWGMAMCVVPFTHACAQTTAPTPQPVQYQAVQLLDGQTNYDFSDKVYALKEEEAPLNIQTIEQKIISGEIISSRLSGSHINVGHQELGTWIVFAVVNNSKKDMWALDLGTLKDLSLIHI